MSGKRDRPAHFQLDEKTLEYKQDQQKKKQTEKDSDQKIKQRTFYKIKVPGESQASTSQSKPKFTFFESAQKAEDQPQKTQESQQQQKSSEDKQKNQKVENKEPAKKQQQKKSIFGFSFPGFDTKKSQFGNGIGIFTNIGGNKNQGIFSKTNIFSRSTSGEANKQQNGSKPTTSIFGTSQSVFNFNFGVPPVKKQAQGQVDDGGEQGNSQQIQQAQNQVIDPTKSTGKYQYKSQCETLFKKKALKTKKDNGDMIENTEVIIQHDNEKQSYWVVVRLAATKHPIVTGYLIKGKCEVKKLGNKSQNIVASVVTFKDKKPQIHVLKIQFQTPEDGESFKQSIQKIIK